MRDGHGPILDDHACSDMCVFYLLVLGLLACFGNFDVL